MSKKTRASAYEQGRSLGSVEHTGDSTVIYHSDGSTSHVSHHDGYDDVVHVGRGGRTASRRIVPVFTTSDGDGLEAVAGFGTIVLFIFLVFGLFAVRNSAYSMMAAPYMVYRLATGGGIGLPMLLILGGVMLLCAIIARFTESAGVTLATVWSFLAGIMLIIVNIRVYENPAFVYHFETENLIEYIGYLISAEVHVFFFMLLLQMVIMTFSCNLTHMIMHWTVVPVIFIALNVLSWIFTLFGSDVPNTVNRYYSMIEPLCKVLGFSKADMMPFLTWGAKYNGLISMVCYCVLGVAAIVFIIWFIYTLITD